jgi:hypothetical protein
MFNVIRVTLDKMKKRGFAGDVSTERRVQFSPLLPTYEPYPLDRVWFTEELDAIRALQSKIEIWKKIGTNMI